MAKLMGIVNVTPDSFFAGSRVMEQDALDALVRRMAAAGTHAIDVGACSTRPSSEPCSGTVEIERLEWALPVVRDATLGTCLLSVDTFRPDIARRSVTKYGVDIINDVSGGSESMYDVVADTGAMYVLTFGRCDSSLDVMADATAFFESRIDTLTGMGVDAGRQLILDPGFGFGKTMDENWALLAGLDRLKCFGLPVLAGLSRKSMACSLLGITPAECLAPTVAMNMAALERGADWIRVHDVTQGLETLRIFDKLTEVSPGSELWSPALASSINQA